MGTAGLLYGMPGLAAYNAGAYTYTTETISQGAAFGGFLFGGIGLTIDGLGAARSGSSCG
jgi:hypothetical protein